MNSNKERKTDAKMARYTWTGAGEPLSFCCGPGDTLKASRGDDCPDDADDEEAEEAEEESENLEIRPEAIGIAGGGGGISTIEGSSGATDTMLLSPWPTSLASSSSESFTTLESGSSEVDVASS